MTTYPPFDPSALLVSPNAKARGITVAQGANAPGTVLARGTLLGRVTTTDKYIPCVKSATDGSQSPAMVLAYDLDASTADAQGPAYDDAEVAGEMLTIDASWTLQTLRDWLRQNASRIYVRLTGTNG